MKSLDQWLDEYSIAHQNKTNQLIHKICVPLIFWSVIALTLSVSVFHIPLFYPIIFLAMIFYARLGTRAVLIASAYIMISFLFSVVLEMRGIMLPTAITIFILAWIGQFIGHRIEGSRPKFLKDLQFLLIGPLWVTKK